MNHGMIGASRIARCARWGAVLTGITLLSACGFMGIGGKSGQAKAPGAATSPVTVPGANEFTLRSAAGKDYRIFVALPDGKPPAAGFPVLYLLDGNAYFVAAADAMREQSTFASMSQVQPMIVVGVGYPGDQPLNGERRGFDFLPPLAGPVQDPRSVQGASPGGADAFLGFLVDELRPVLAARYPIDPARQSLAGHSLGGYFALHALLNRPDAFRSYMAISPSLWWHDGSMMKIAAQRLPALRPARPVDVLLAVSPLEMPAYADLSAVMLSATRTMNGMLAQATSQGVRTQYQELPGENHISTNLAAMSAILRQASRP
jgi:predicted alpha/beta superfamily hydrolase